MINQIRNEQVRTCTSLWIYGVYYINLIIIQTEEGNHKYFNRDSYYKAVTFDWRLDATSCAGQPGPNSGRKLLWCVWIHAYKMIFILSNFYKLEWGIKLNQCNLARFL